jgi:hypothetical protein
MYKSLMLTLVTLSLGGWLQAQTYPQAVPTQTPGTKTVQGCLQGSGGAYTLTADSGMTYQLTGNTSELSAHIGHEVEITGKSASSSPAGNTSESTSVASQQATLDVQGMKHIAEKCKTPAK